MSFNDDLLTATKTTGRPGGKCLCCEWRETVSKTDRKEFDTATADLHVQSMEIYKAMRNNKDVPFEGSYSSVRRHRAGECQ